MSVALSEVYGKSEGKMF